MENEEQKLDIPEAVQSEKLKKKSLSGFGKFLWGMGTGKKKMVDGLVVNTDDPEYANNVDSEQQNTEEVSEPLQEEIVSQNAIKHPFLHELTKNPAFALEMQKFKSNLKNEIFEGVREAVQEETRFLREQIFKDEKPTLSTDGKIEFEVLLKYLQKTGKKSIAEELQRIFEN